MKQYCRYCSWFVCGNGEYCERLNKEMSEYGAKRANKCRFFDFNEIDAYNIEHKYKPHKQKEEDGEQVRI